MILSLDYINTGIYNWQECFDSLDEHINSRIIKHLSILPLLYFCRLLG